jgi:hypothetical protein
MPILGGTGGTLANAKAVDYFTDLKNKTRLKHSATITLGGGGSPAPLLR